jgi:hypothetical protein
MRVRGTLIALVLVAGCKHPAPQPAADTGKHVVEAPAAPQTQTGTTPSQGQPATNPPAPAPPPPPLPATVRVSVRTSPPRKAKVFWGRKLLGMTPLQFERPRASGPLDLVLRADGYFPVHVRAYTDWNDGLTVELTKLSDRMKLFGAKRELPIDPAVTGTTDPGAPAAAGASTPGAAPTIPAGGGPSPTQGVGGPVVPVRPSPAAPPPATR